MRPQAELRFSATPCARLTGGVDGWNGVEALLAKAAVLTAFEQIGGAQACLDMACDYAVKRMAFGRAIGSFQAIKHKLARLFIAIELARSNASYGAWAATQSDRGQLLEAAACARISASEAFEQSATENIQTHGGIGYTWESDCHLFHRRAKLLAVNLGSTGYWSRVLADLVIPASDREANHGF
nr:acyl-CoA dehydrogenase family protein [Sphingomonas tagetis]